MSSHTSMVSLILIMSLCFFISSDLSLMTFFLLANMMMIIFTLFFKFNFFWISLLYGITIVSGLMVIFSYISGISPKSPVSVGKSIFLFIFFLGLIFLFVDLYDEMESKNYFITSTFYSNYQFVLESLFLFTILFILIIFFLRFSYSKGGGFRKKF